MKLPYSQVKPLREQLLIQQSGHCALCREPVIDDAVLDHDHDTGLIRGVLHRGCNAMLGKIENNMPRNRIDLQRLSILAENLIKYLTADAKSEFLHPTYKTPEERKMKKKKPVKPPKRY